LAYQRSHPHKADSQRPTFSSGDLRYPDSLADFLADGYHREFSQVPGSTSYSDGRYVFSYQRVVDPAENFVLSSRPLKYGVTGLRSYVVDNAGVPRATDEDRAATMQDELAWKCELDLYSSECSAPVATGPVDLGKLFPAGNSGESRAPI